MMLGRAARMRESSRTMPSWMGTLKSTRMRTRLPCTSTSRMVRLSMLSLPVRPARRCSGEAGGHEGDEVGHAAAVAPLVVVPGEDLDEVTAEAHRGESVDDGAALVTLEVHRDERAL